MTKTILAKSKNPLASEVLDAACRKWPGVPSRTLARMCFEDPANKGLFSNIEAARKGVLYRRGRNGRSHRAVRGGAGNAFPSIAWNPRKLLPVSDEQPFEPFRVTVERTTQVLVLGDIHIPYHNIPALECALKEGQRRGCKIILLNGDTLDFYRLSRFQKDPRKRGAKDEIARANQLLDAIDELFPKARKILKYGNHDERYDHYLQLNAPEIYQLVAEKCALEKLLELEERGWEVVADKRPIYLGELPVIHGHEYPTPVLGPVNAARGLFLRAKDCAMVNHHHQTSEHTETSIKGKMITTWSLGCLCDLHPEYARFNKWNHGAATVELTKEGDFSVHNFRIHEGRKLN